MDPRRMTELPTTIGLEALVGEEMIESVPGVGASLAVTPTRVVLIRDGADRRPRTGIREWAHAAVDVRMEPPRGGDGRIVLLPGGNANGALSLFVRSAAWPVAVRAVEAIRTEARRARRAARADALERSRARARRTEA